MTLAALKSQTNYEALYGISLESAHHHKICVNCKRIVHPGYSHSLKPGQIYSPTGEEGYRISGLCEYCFDELAKDIGIEHGELPF